MMGCDISVYCTLQSIMCRSNKCSNPNICSFSNEEYVVSLIVLGDRKSNPQGRLFHLDPNFCTLTSETKLPTGDHFTSSRGASTYRPINYQDRAEMYN